MRKEMKEHVYLLTYLGTLAYSITIACFGQCIKYNKLQATFWLKE